jgi:hypothetical protein
VTVDTAQENDVGLTAAVVVDTNAKKIAALIVENFAQNRVPVKL